VRQHQRQSPWTATQFLHAQGHVEDDGTGRCTVIHDVRAWLRQALAVGLRPAPEPWEDAKVRGIGRGALYAAHKAEDFTFAKERTAQGRGIWTFNSHSGEIEDGALPGSSDVQHLQRLSPRCLMQSRRGVR